MANCRVFYKADGSVAVMVPAPKARLEGETDDVFLQRICDMDAPKIGLGGIPFDDMDKINLPERATRDKWRGNTQQGVYVDNSVVTKNERIQAIQGQIDAELDKPMPNAGLVLKLQRDIRTIVNE